jgi:putative chitinase
MDLKKLESKMPLSVAEQIPMVMDKFKIDTALRLSHFLAQCAHESGNFKVTTENLNYSKEGLMKVFPKYFPNEVIAKQYERKPNTIANKVYGNRMGNGDENSNDGSTFKGRGYIQLTGKEGYSAFDKFVDDDIIANPDLVATKYPLLSAAWFWNSRNLNALADKGASDADVTAIRKKVNGGKIGLADTIKQFNFFYNILK